VRHPCLLPGSAVSPDTVAQKSRTLVNGGEKVVGFGAPSLVTTESGEARGGAQFPELGFLLPGDAQGFATVLLGGVRMPLPQQQLAFVPIKLRFKPTGSPKGSKRPILRRPKHCLK
jgi:hypothetical protein